jgi:LacI family transcriptional regulator
VKKTPRIMLLIESSRAYERALLRGIAKYSRQHGPWIFFREAPFWEKRPHKALVAQLETVDGIIMRECSYMPEIMKLNKPVIVSNYATEHIGGLPNIVSDHREIGRMAADHLIERGFRNFAFCGYGDFFWSNQRYEGFRKRVHGAGHEVYLYDTPRTGKQMLWKKEQQFVTDWLRSLPKPVGLMACIDERSQQVAEACKAAAMTVPDDVAIVGVDNDEMICNLSNIPLSSVAIDAEKGGYEAAALMSVMLKKQQSIRKSITIRPTHVVTRTSTDIVAVEDPHVAAAVKYIRDHCRQEIYVKDVARAAGLSRRVLEKRFRAALARSINQQVRQSRIQMIINMLLGTTMTISEIAFSMGFPDAAHIARYFRSQTNSSPAEYRRRYRP